MGLQSISGLLTTQINSSNKLFSLLAAQIAKNDRLAVSAAIDPSAFVISEGVRSQLASLDAGSRSVQLGQAITSLADARLAGVSDQLSTVRSLSVQASIATGDERAALQSAIDTSLSHIDAQLSGTFLGRFGGAGAAFQTTTDPNQNITNLSVTQTPAPVNGTPVNVDITVNAVGTQASATLNGVAGIGAGQQFQITGSTGTQTLTYGGSVQGLADAINAGSSQTGLAAAVAGGNIVLNSINYGSSESIGVTNISAAGLTLAGNTNGTDADVAVNGVQASAAGNVVSFNDSELSGTFSVAPTTPAATNVVLQAVSGGITVPTDGTGGSLTFGVPAFGSSLGSSSGLGSLSALSSGSPLATQLAVLDAAQGEILAGRTQIASVDSALASAGATIENQIGGLSAANADLRSVDLASSAVELTRNSLQQQLTALLIRENNVTHANILRLLGK
jgi:flagellin-like hook-associated protein FlgL